jgi:hypothetical protein
MSMPYCLTNPTLSHVQTSCGFVVLERIAASDYKVLRGGKCLGRVHKAAKWRVDGKADEFSTRAAAVEAVVAASPAA